MLDLNTSEQKNVSVDLREHLTFHKVACLWANRFLSSAATVEGSWLDLARRSKPDTQPYAHLTINATDIPSGMFHLHPA